MIRASFAALAIAVAFGPAIGDARAQVVNQDHGEYSRADVEAGQRLYGAAVPALSRRQRRHRARASTCGGAGSAARRPTRTWRAVITHGRPGHRHAGLQAAADELDGLVAFIRAGLRRGGTAVRVGDADRGQALFEGKGGCAHLPPREGKGPRVAPDLSDIGAIRTPAALQRSLLDPTGAMLPINRPVRDRDERRPHDPRPAAERGHLHGAADRRRRSGWSRSTRPTCASYEVATTSPMPSYAKEAERRRAGGSGGVSAVAEGM